MASNACAGTGWLEENHQGMIRCPYQPGHLVISRAACVKRHTSAAETDYDDIMRVDPFTHRLKRGLLLCSGCPIGKRLVAGSPGREPVDEPQCARAVGA